MTIRIVRRTKMTPTPRIGYALEAIERHLYNVVGYMKAGEDRQEIYSTILSGLMPMLQKLVAETLGPKYPIQPWIPLPMRPPKRSHKAKK